MEFFHEPKIDWMEIKWYFISLSLALALTGIISMVVHRGLVYGIDFRGGTMVNVKFSQAPNVDAIRRELDRAGLRNATIQQYGPASDHAVIIGARPANHHLQQCPGHRQAGGGHRPFGSFR